MSFENTDLQVIDSFFEGIGLDFPNPDMQPIPHQKRSIYAGIKQKKFTLHLDLGGGKTMVSLHIFKALKLMGEVKRGLVLVPNTLNCREWVLQTEIHRPDLRIEVLTGSTKKDRRIEILRDDSIDLIVMPYSGMRTLITDLVPIKNGKRKGKTRQNVNRSYVKDRFNGITLVVFDEVTMLKSVRSVTFRACEMQSRACVASFGLTGTPFGRHIEDLWAEFYAVDHGKTLGASRDSFIKKYFHVSPKYWGGYEFKFKKEKWGELLGELDKGRIVFRSEDFKGWPEMAPPNNIYIQATEEIKNIRKTILERLYSQFSNPVSTDDSLELLWMQSLTLSSGWLNYADPNGGGRKTHILEQNPKLDMVCQYADQIPDGHKGVIFHHFIISGDLMEQRLKACDIKYQRIMASMNETTRNGNISKFLEDDDCKVLLISDSLGSMGLNLQKANYIFFMELPMGADKYKQAIGRVHRMGQTNRTYVYHFLVEGLADNSLFGYIKEGNNLNRSVMRDPDLLKRWLK